MEQLTTQLLQELLYALVSVGFGFLIAILKKYNGSAKMIKIQQELKTHEDLAKGVVLAVQSIYKDMNGNAKLNQAILMLSTKLANAGIKLSADEIHALIESTLVKAKEEFQNAWDNTVNQEDVKPVVDPTPVQPTEPVTPVVDPTQQPVTPQQ